MNASSVPAPTMVVAYSNLKNMVYGGRLSVVISANNHTVSNINYFSVQLCVKYACKSFVVYHDFVVLLVYKKLKGGKP